MQPRDRSDERHGEAGYRRPDNEKIKVTVGCSVRPQHAQERAERRVHERRRHGETDARHIHIASRANDDKDPKEADQHRAPAVRSHALLQEERNPITGRKSDDVKNSACASAMGEN